MNKQEIFNKIVFENFNIIFVWFTATQTNALKFWGELYLYLELDYGILSIQSNIEERPKKILIDSYENTGEQRRKISGDDFDSFYKKLINKIKLEYINSSPSLFNAEYYLKNIKDKEYLKKSQFNSVYWQF